MNLAIFVSGRGTNCENIIKYFQDSDKVHVTVVISNRADAYALVRAERLGVPTEIVPKKQLNDEQEGCDRHRLVPCLYHTGNHQSHGHGCQDGKPDQEHHLDLRAA